MIKPNKAIEMLIDWNKDLELFPEDEKESIEYYEIAIKALEKQIPQKPIFDHNLNDNVSMFICKCGNRIKVTHDSGVMNNNNTPNYCCNCGNKLDWSDEE